MRERGGLGIELPIRATDARMLEDIESLRVGGHERVFDAVVHHFDEVAGPIGPQCR